MISEIKCPTCGQKLDKDYNLVYRCLNRKCKAFGFSLGTRELWQALKDEGMCSSYYEEELHQIKDKE